MSAKQFFQHFYHPSMERTLYNPPANLLLALSNLHPAHLWDLLCDEEVFGVAYTYFSHTFFFVRIGEEFFLSHTKIEYDKVIELKPGTVYGNSMMISKDFMAVAQMFVQTVKWHETKDQLKETREEEKQAPVTLKHFHHPDCGTEEHRRAMPHRYLTPNSPSLLIEVKRVPNLRGNVGIAYSFPDGETYYFVKNQYDVLNIYSQRLENLVFEKELSVPNPHITLFSEGGYEWNERTAKDEFFSLLRIYDLKRQGKFIETEEGGEVQITLPMKLIAKIDDRACTLSNSLDGEIQRDELIQEAILQFLEKPISK